MLYVCTASIYLGYILNDVLLSVTALISQVYPERYRKPQRIILTGNLVSPVACTPGKLCSASHLRFYNFIIRDLQQTTARAGNAPDMFFVNCFICVVTGQGLPRKGIAHTPGEDVSFL